MSLVQPMNLGLQIVSKEDTKERYRFLINKDANKGIEMWFESDKDFKHETLFDEDIFRTVTDMIQHEDDP